MKQGEKPEPECDDNPMFARCDLIVRAKMCSRNVYYGEFCCKSCTEAGQLEPQWKEKIKEKEEAAKRAKDEVAATGQKAEEAKGEKAVTNWLWGVGIANVEDILFCMHPFIFIFQYL